MTLPSVDKQKSEALTPSRYAIGDRLAAIITYLLMVSGSYYYAYFKIFSVFMSYDDEGYLMISVKKFNDGLSLYDQVFTQYGPFYYLYKWLLHVPLAIPVSHDITRLTTIFLWVSTSFFCSLLTFRISRSLLIASLVYMGTFLHLTSLIYEPGHPQGLCILLISVVLLLSTYVNSSFRTTLSIFGMGLILGALFYTKINLGVFLFISLALTFLAFKHWDIARRAITYFLIVFTVFLPQILMRSHLYSEWAFYYSTLVSLSLIPILAVMFIKREKACINCRHFALMVTAFVIMLFGTTVFVYFRGTSLFALFDGVLLRPLRFATTYYSPMIIFKSGVIFGIISLVLALKYIYKKTSLRTSRNTFLHIVKLLIGIMIFVIGNQHMSSHNYLFSYFTPFLWLLLLPPYGKNSWHSHQIFPRTALCMVAALQTLQAYPVYGSQITWATFLLIPSFGICIGDTFSNIMERITDRHSYSWSKLFQRVVYPLCLAILFTSYYFKADIQTVKHRYDNSLPLGLSGSKRIRLDYNQVAIYQWLTNNLRMHAETFVTMPGYNSFYFWSEIEPPTALNTTAWMTLLDDKQQQTIVQKLNDFNNICVLRNSPQTDAWLKGRDKSTKLLVRYINDFYETLFSYADYEFLVKKDRNQAYLFNSLLSGAKAFDGLDDIIPLPNGMLSQNNSLTISLWIKTSDFGGIVGIQNNKYPEKSYNNSASIIYVGGDGKLRGQFWNGHLAPITNDEAINDGIWHHVVLVGNNTEQNLYIDGRLVGSMKGKIEIQQMQFTQIGTVYADKWPESNGDWYYFSGSLKDVVLINRPLNESEVQDLYQHGLPAIK